MHIMRTTIVIDPALLETAMKAGPYKTKKEAVEAGLKLLARRVAYRELAAMRGKLKSWDGEPWDDLGSGAAPEAPSPAEPLTAEEPMPEAPLARR